MNWNAFPSSQNSHFQNEATGKCKTFLAGMSLFAWYTKSLGNLRTMMKFTTTTSVDWEKTGTRTSVSAGKRKLKMQSVGWSMTKTLNVKTNVKL